MQPLIETVTKEPLTTQYESDAAYLVDQFINDQLSPHTRRAYAIDITQFRDYCRMKKWSFDHPKDFRSDHIRGYRDFLLNDMGLAPNSIIRKMSTLREMMSFFVNESLIPANPFLNCKLPRSVIVRPTQDLSDEDVRLVLLQPDRREEVGRLHFTLMVGFFYLLTRASELRLAKVKDIQYRRKHKVLMVTGKRSKTRDIVLTPFVDQTFETYMMRSRYEFGPNDYIFRPTKNNVTGAFDQPLTIPAINYIVKKYVKAAGIKKRITSHSGRATGISHLLESGVSLRQVAVMVGHDNYATTSLYDKRRKNLDKSASYLINYES